MEKQAAAMESLLPLWMVSAKSPRTVWVMLSMTFMALYLLTVIPVCSGVFGFIIAKKGR